jgi:hypothetical protein
MAQGTKRVAAASVYMWIGIAALIAFNTAAAMSHNPRLAYAALALSGVAALTGIGFGIWASLTLAKQRRHF